MKSILTAAAMAIVAFAGPALAQKAKQDFVLINQTGYDLEEAYISPAKTNNWGPDVFSHKILKKGMQIGVHFNPTVQTCFWDIKLVYNADHTPHVWSGVDLCKLASITVMYDAKTNTTNATFK